MTSEDSDRTALIVGCGVAGPVLGMFLQRIGITPIIFESQPRPRDEAGFFLNLAANGTNVLDELGVLEHVLDSGYRTDQLVFLNHEGKTLGESRHETVLIRRGTLTKTLREEALDRGIIVEFGKRLTDVETPHEGTTIAHFDDGTESYGEFLVGCDGIHSQTRRSVLPNAPEPEYTGILDSGGFTHNGTIPPSNGTMWMTFGVNGFFGYQKVPTGEIFWFENHERTTEPERRELEAIPTADWIERLLDLHRPDHDEVTRILESTDGAIGTWPVYDLPSLPTWHRGAVCLIGDAAHATSPHVGQGASLAMEDAIVLAKCLCDVDAVPSAFRTFENRRRERVEDVAEISRTTGHQKAPSNALARKVRDTVLPFFLKRGVENFERIHSYRVVWADAV